MSRGILFVMSGPSGTGKGTICEQLIKTEDIFLSISSTTREKRKGEIDGVTYNYTTVDEFEKLIKDGQMFEYAKYNGNYYGTPKATVEQMLAKGTNVLLEIEPQGALKVKSAIPDAVLLFVLPPSMKVLKERLITRGREKEHQISERLEAAKWEIEQSSKYAYLIVNAELEDCVAEVKEIFNNRKEKQKLAESLLIEEY